MMRLSLPGTRARHATATPPLPRPYIGEELVSLMTDAGPCGSPSRTV